MVAAQLAVALAAVVSIPSFLQLARGELDLSMAVLRFFLALIVSWVACNAVSAITAAYWSAAKSRPHRADTEPPAADGGGNAQ